MSAAGGRKFVEGLAGVVACDMSIERRHTYDCTGHLLYGGCTSGCETDDELRSRWVKEAPELP